MQIQNEMFNLVISHHRIMRDFTTLDPICITAPPIRLVLSQPHYYLHLYGYICNNISKVCGCIY